MIKLFISFFLVLAFSLPSEARKIKNRADSVDRKEQRIKKRRKQIIGFQPREKSIELLLGQPTGGRYQQWLSFKRAFNVDLAYHTKEQILTNLNYAIYFFDARDKIKRKDFWNSAYFYYGPGIFSGKEIGSKEDEDDFLFGIRGFFGMDYIFVNSNYAIRTEAALTKYISGDDSIGMQLFIGLAYRWDRGRKKYYKRLK